MSSTRERLADAAFALFEERGFHETTVDDVADRAGVSRTTFFRAFQSKEDVIFPDHDVVIAAIGDRLATSTSGTAPLAVTEAARLVLQHYLEEGKRARIRYALTRSVPALRAREIASQQRYQQTFRRFLHAWMTDASDASLRAELMANAVVTAHNHVLRSWLRGEMPAEEAETEFDRAMSLVVDIHAPTEPTRHGGESSLVVLHTTRDLRELLPQLRELAGSTRPVVLD